LVDSLSQPNWIRKVVGGISTSGFAEIVLVVRNLHPPEAPSPVQRAIRLRRFLLYGLHRRIDDFLSRKRSNAFEPSTIVDLVDGIPILDVMPIRKGQSDRIADEDLDRIAGYDLDVLLRFGFQILRGHILDVPRYGVWSYHHGDNTRYRGQPAGFWEVADGEPVTGTMLQVLNEDLDNGQVLYRSFSSTSRWSPQANRNRNFWKSSTFVIRALRAIQQSDETQATATREPPIAPYARRIYRTPTNREMLHGIARIGGRAGADAVRSLLYHDQWFLAYQFRSDPTPRYDQSFHRFKRLIPPPDRFWADPFPVMSNGRHYLFSEEYLYETERAHISVMEIDRVNGAGKPSVALAEPFHLSYPFMFEWRGDHYMIPEMADKGDVLLYRARSFPHDWQPVQTLLEGVPGVDATLAEIDGTWWMFVNIAPDPDRYGDNDELHVYFADTPLGPWTPCRGNPVKSDVRSARPAGRLFRHGGHWIRPSQDCSRRYGYAINFNRITSLTRDSYCEVEVAKVLPEWAPELLGNHTYNQIAGLTCVDGVRRKRIRG
jgi:hypothetical protein